MSHISDHLRQKVRQRAGNRCEYCLSCQKYVLGPLQIDHIIPIIKGGTDNAENLCLDGFDKNTRQRVPLFHPRRQRWSEHFAWSSDETEILGLTACGRVTVDALQLNNDLAMTVRKNWIRAGWHPPTVTT